MEFDLKHALFKHPFNCLLVGMTGSGKTELMRKIIKNFKKIFYNINKEKLKVLWCYGQDNELIDVQLSKNVEIKFIEGITDEIKSYDVIVIDDLLNEMSNFRDFENIFIKKSHHLNASVFFLTQNIFYNSKSMRTISLNCHYIILLKNPRDQSQITHLAKQVCPGNLKFLVEAFNDATEMAYGYIRLDFKPDTPQILRVQSRITPEGNNDLFIPVVYVPEKCAKKVKNV